MVPESNLLSSPIETHDIGAFSFLLFSLLPIENAEAGIFTRITMTSMTGKWYLRLNHFEALLVGLVVLQIFVMRYFLILPLDVTKLIDDGTLLATSVSRKKRETMCVEDVIKQQRFAETMFTVIRRLDENDCVVRALCELEYSNSYENQKYSNGITNLLERLKRLGYQRIRNEGLEKWNNVTITERKVLSVFEDAVLFGTRDSLFKDEFKDYNHLNSTESRCALQYSLCSADKNELLGYVKNIEPFMM